MLLNTNLRALSAALIIVFCTLVCAQTQPQGSTSIAPSTAEPTVGTISGSVVNENGQPLSGAAVFIRNTGPNPSARTSMTDAEGNFRFNGLEPSLYLVSASFPTYVSLPYDPTSTANYYRIGDSVRLELIRGGVITGTVTNAAGEGVIGLPIRATMVRTANGGTPKPFGYIAVDRTTDDRGVYRIFGLPPGTYVVSSGGGGNLQRFELNPYESDLPTYSPASTRDTAAEIVVRSGEETTADIRYRGEPGHVVSGTVKLTSQFMGNVSLTPAGSSIPTAMAFQMQGARGFAFNGIADGEYDIVATEVKQNTASMTMPDVMMSEPRRITIKGADVTGLELVTRPLAALSGRVVLEPAKVTACEGKRRPLFAETLIILQRSEADKDSPQYMRAFTGSTVPDTKGDFLLRNVTPGRYLFEPRFYARYWYLSSITAPGTPKVDAAANWTNVKAGDQLANYTITIAEGAASVRGSVTAASGEIPTGLGVYLAPAEREKIPDVLRYFVTPVAADRTFTLSNLPPGRYLAFVQPIDADTGTIAKLRLPEAAEKRTKLRRAAETQKTDLELKPCQNLSEQKLSLK